MLGALEFSWFSPLLPAVVPFLSQLKQLCFLYGQEIKMMRLCLRKWAGNLPGEARMELTERLDGRGSHLGRLLPSVDMFEHKRGSLWMHW